MMSFLHHMALQRLCRNPFEKGEIAGITNYLDVGLQVMHWLTIFGHWGCVHCHIIINLILWLRA